jgi:hypothetical protein
MENKVFEIKEIFLDEIDSLANFLSIESQICLSSRDWKKKIKWIWEKNPFYHPKDPIGWKITSNDNKIYGFLGNIPIENVKIKCFKSYWATSWYVNIEARSYSIRLFKKFANQKGLLFNNTPITKIEPILTKLFQFRKPSNYWFNSSILFLFNPYKNGFFNFKLTRNSILNIFFYCFFIFILIFRNILYFFFRIIISKKLKIKIREKISNITKDEEMVKWLFTECDNANCMFLYDIYDRDKVVASFLLKIRNTERFSYLECIDCKIHNGSTINILSYYIELSQFLQKNHKNICFLILKSNKNLKIFKYILGFKTKINQNTYFKNNLNIDHLHYSPTSLDGDSVFF